MATGQVILLLGALVALTGLILVIAQLRQKRRYASRSLHAKAGPLAFTLKTTFVGLVVLGFGVLLLVVAAIVPH
jgi:hypothetical protein